MSIIIGGGLAGIGGGGGGAPPATFLPLAGGTMTGQIIETFLLVTPDTQDGDTLPSTHQILFVTPDGTSTLDATTAINDGVEGQTLIIMNRGGGGDLIIPDGANTDFGGGEDIQITEKGSGLFVFQQGEWHCGGLWSRIRGRTTSSPFQVFSDIHVGGTLLGAQNLLLDGDGHVDFREVADGGNPGAALGRLWVENTVPNRLIFTDDTDTDLVIGVGTMSKHMAALLPNDAFFPATDPGGGIGRNGHAEIAYDDATAESVIFQKYISADYNSSNNLFADIVWVAKTATTGDVVWGLEFERISAAGHDIDADSFAAQQKAAADTTAATAGIPTVTRITLTNAQADALAAGDRFRARAKREPADAGDNMSGDAEILGILLSQ